MIRNVEKIYETLGNIQETLRNVKKRWKRYKTLTNAKKH